MKPNFYNLERTGIDYNDWAVINYFIQGIINGMEENKNHRGFYWFDYKEAHENLGLLSIRQIKYIIKKLTTPTSYCPVIFEKVIEKSIDGTKLFLNISDEILDYIIQPLLLK